MEAIVLAGGKGTRLAGYLNGLPKPMVDIGGRPFLEYLFDLLVTQGIDRVILSVGHGADIVETHFRNGYSGLRIVFAREDTPLGTGGAISNALRSSRSSDVFVVNGDTLVQIDYRSMLREHHRRGANVSVAVCAVPDVSRYGAILTDESDVIRKFGEKRVVGEGLINSGTYLLRRDVFEGYKLPAAFSMEIDFLSAHLHSIRPSAFKTDGYFIDIGVPKDLERARREFPDLRFGPVLRRCPKRNGNKTVP